MLAFPQTLIDIFATEAYAPLLLLAVPQVAAISIQIWNQIPLDLLFIMN